MTCTKFLSEKQKEQVEQSTQREVKRIKGMSKEDRKKEVNELQWMTEGW